MYSARLASLAFIAGTFASTTELVVEKLEQLKHVGITRKGGALVIEGTPLSG